jgi:hypothetical protein
MGLRDRVRRLQRIHQREGLGGVWRATVGRGVKGWKTATKWAGWNIRVAVYMLGKAKHQREAAVEDLHRLADEIVEEQQQRQRAEQHLEAELKKPDRDQREIERLRSKIRECTSRLERLRDRVHEKQTQKTKAIAAAHHAIQRRKWAVKARTIYRRRLKKAKQRAEETGKAEWEPWMANGANANVVQAVKDEVAIAVVKFGCAVSSLWRAVVIALSNPNSWHGPNVNPGKAGDLVGDRMDEYQEDVFERRRGDPDLLESFGPINDLCLKNGIPLTLAEGDFLETLHDSHEHVACQ